MDISESQSKGTKNTAVAIIGLGCLFPGSDNLSAYWRAISEGRDAIGDIPADHWSVADYYDPDPKAEDKTYGRRGGFLSPVAFEPMKYGIVPKDISAIDATQLLGLVAADQALVDAGYGPASGYDHGRTAVLLGVTGALKMVVSLGSRLAHPQIRRALADSGVDEATASEVLKRFAAEFTPWTENSFPGLLGNVTAGRIANRLDLGGSNMVVDAACASSLAAIRQGLMELSSGQADLVVSGGLDTFSDPFMYTCFSKTPALSPSGDVRPYDQSGDGTVLGEGIGVVILKRLDEARRDGDRIYAVIRSVGSSSDGKGTAIFAPSAEGQRRALLNTYENAGVDPGTVGLVEGHGTGTAVGDAVEVEALNGVFRDSPRAGQGQPWCALGSVKAQIGHTKAAAGAAGLIKAAMALHMKSLPPTAKVVNPLPSLVEAGSPFHLSTRLRPWISAGPRRAAVSAFGFGGSNFHCLLEESEPIGSHASAPADLVLAAFSADSQAGLAEALNKALAAEEPQAAARESRASFDSRRKFRLALAAGERDWTSLVRQSLKILAEPEIDAQVFPDGVFFGQGSSCPDRFGYLLPGPESVRQEMLRDLVLGWPELLNTLSEAAAELAETAPDLAPLDLILYPPDLASPEMLQAWRKDLADPRLGLAVARAMSQGLMRILEKFGLRPAAVVGGEDSPVNLVQEFHRKNNLSVSLWLEIGCGCEMSLSVLSAFGKSHQVLALDGGGDGHEDLARFLARLAAWGLPLALSAWPSAQPFEERRIPSNGESFAVDISGANYFVKETIPPSAKAARQPGSPEKSLTEILEHMTAETALLHQEFLTRQAEALRLIGLSLEQGAEAVNAVPPPAPRAAAIPSALPVKVQAAGPVEAGPMATAASGMNAESVLAIVSRETGYPVEMLSPEMDLEADLGLDSIKKVEIMAVLSEENPEVQSLGAESMSRAQTLADLIALAGASAPAGLPDSLPAAAPAETFGGHKTAELPLRGLWPMLREVVAAETGYPQEMLAPHMRLGDDLGLDSIKMVEIASLMSERLPEAAALSADSLASAQTLADLAAALEAVADPGQAASGRIPAPKTQEEPNYPVSGSSAPDLRPGPVAAGPGTAEIVLEVVSKETGYPRDMLKMNMNLEADLGLDSIKKVEIMAALSERLPQVEALADGEALTGLQTLGDLAALTGGSPSPAGSSVIEETSAAVPAARPRLSAVEELLLEVVSAETGYPKDMLSLDASLEADLGLDSIKRVEIMAALSEKLGDDSLAASSAEILAEAVTLGDLVKLLPAPAPVYPSVSMGGQKREQEIKKRGPGRPPKNSPPAFKVENKAEQSPEVSGNTAGVVSSFKVELAPLDPSSSTPFPFNAGGVIALLSDDSPLAEALAADLESRTRLERIAWDEIEKIARLNDLVGLIMVWPGLSNDLALARRSFQALKAAGPGLLKKAERGGEALLMGLSFLGGGFGEDGTPPPSPVSSALNGLLKTAAREWPGLKVRAVDLPAEALATDGPEYAPFVLNVAGSGFPVEVGLPSPGFYQTPKLAPYKLKNIRVRHLREGQTLLVTGGGRGVTAAALKEVARAFKPHLVIMGRTPLSGDEPRWLENLADEAAVRKALFDRAQVKPNPRDLAKESARIMAGREIKANLAAMEKAGAKVTYISGDFQNAEALVPAVTEVKRLYGPIHGFIHGAGVLADSLILDKKDEDFDRVFDTKAGMAGLILSELDDQPLNLVIFFSSSTARFGRKGQADYAAGNEVLNKLARSMAGGRLGPKCLAVNWGPWAGGMVDAGLARLFEEEGIGLIPLPEGARLLAALAGAPKNDPVEVVVLGPTTDMSALL